VRHLGQYIQLFVPGFAPRCHLLCQYVSDTHADVRGQLCTARRLFTLFGAPVDLAMYIWGSQRIPTLQSSYLQVLPSLSSVLDSHLLVVAEEVVFTLRRLVGKYGDTIRIEWESVFEILEKVSPERAKSWIVPSAIDTSTATLAASIRKEQALQAATLLFGAVCDILAAIDRM
jgi:hypothetical protein